MKSEHGLASYPEVIDLRGPGGHHVTGVDREVRSRTSRGAISNSSAYVPHRPALGVTIRSKVTGSAVHPGDTIDCGRLGDPIESAPGSHLNSSAYVSCRPTRERTMDGSRDHLSPGGFASFSSDTWFTQYIFIRTYLL